MAGIDDRFRTPPELVVGALVAAGTLPVARLFGTGGIVPTILGSILLSGVLAWALRRARVIAPLAAVVTAAAWFWFAGLLFFRGSLLGILPTPGMFRAVALGIADGVRTATTEVAPVTSSGPLLALMSMIVWGVTFLADDAVHKLRHPLLAIGFVMPVFVFPGTLADSSHRWLDAGLFIAACCAVLFTDEATRLSRWGRTAGIGSPGWKPGLAARIGTLITIAAIALAPFVPGYANVPGGATGPGGRGEGGLDRVALNPLVGIRPKLHGTPVIPLFTVVSEAETYWRLTALDQFNGEVWTAPPREASRKISGATITPAIRPPDARRVRQRITIRGLAGPWLPAAFQPVRVDRRKGVRLEPIARALVAGDLLRGGQKYEVVSEIATPTSDDLDQVSAESILETNGIERYLQLPTNGTPRNVVQLALDLTRNAPNPYRKALAIQDYLRRFTYDENVALGHDFTTLDGFLFRTRRGYCEQFSASMAVLARIAGLPSRVAIGFAVGNSTGENTFEITTRHAHAWVELFFPGFGWLPFEPTPRTDSTITPAYARPSAATPAPSISPSTGASASPTPKATGSVDPRNVVDDDTGAAAERAKAKRGVILLWLTVPGGLVLVLGIALPGAAEIRRRRRRGRAVGPAALAVTYYLDFLEWCAAARLPRRPGETPAEYAERLAATAAPAERPLRELASVATRVLWSPQPVSAASGPAAEAERLGREARRGIASGLPRRIRILPVLGWGWWKD